MKKSLQLTLVLYFISISILAQAPQMFNYQAVLRNDAREPIASESVTIDIEILQGNATGTVVFTETHNTETNEFGLINLQIGSVQSLDAVDWGADEYFIEVSVDGTSMGTTQLLSVPYALHAGTAVETDPEFTAWDKSTGIVITESQISDLQEYLTEEIQSLADVAAINNSVNTQIKNLTDPTDPQDAATKAYVDLLKERIEALEIKMILIEGVTDIDGNTYKTVKIGEQLWMAENLRVTKYNNGDAIPTGLNNTDWGNTTDGAYAIYNNDNNMLEAYGKLYNWYAVDDARGLCPSGWRVPTYYDWTELVNYLVEQGYHNEWDNSDPNGVGNALKSCRQIDHPDGGDCATSEHPRWFSHDTHSGFDEFGFSSLPGGYRKTDGTYGGIGSYGHWWSSNKSSSTSEWCWIMLYYYGFVNSYNHYKEFGFSVRCIWDIDAPTNHTLNLNVSPEGRGEANGSGDYVEGAEVPITATANEGYEFVNWTGDTDYIDNSDEASATVTMPGYDVSLIANFEEEEDAFSCGDDVTFIYDGEEVTYGTVEGANGQCWLDRNLGADRVCQSSTDHKCYGDLFQWGRAADGHQLIDRDAGVPLSGTTSTKADTDQPDHDDFILVSADPRDWRDDTNDNRWNADPIVNNPCPEGWRVPTEAEWEVECGNNCDDWSDVDDAFGSALKLSLAGWRQDHHGGAIDYVGTVGAYYSSTVDGIRSRSLYFNDSEVFTDRTARSSGHPVRCLRDN